MAIYNEETDPNVEALNSRKKELIASIKEIINERGEFTDADVQAESSPNLDTKGNLSHIVEDFNQNDVKVEVYGEWENSIDSYTLTYEELEVETLEAIFELAEKWVEICCEEEED